MIILLCRRSPELESGSWLHLFVPKLGKTGEELAKVSKEGQQLNGSEDTFVRPLWRWCPELLLHDRKGLELSRKGNSRPEFRLRTVTGG